MPVAQILVYSNPVAGREAEYHRWYDEQHIPDVLKVPGVVAAQRYATDDGEYSHVAIYELDTTDQAAFMAAMMSRIGTPEMELSDAVDAANTKIVFCNAVSSRQSA